MEPQSRPVPWRTIFAVVAVGVGTAAALWMVVELHRIIAWFVVAGFLAVVLGPAVDFLEHRLRFRRGLATFTVFVTGLALFAGMMYVFIRPIVDQTRDFADKFPTYVEDARNGRGDIGRLVRKYKLDDWVERNQGQLRTVASDAGKLALRNAGKAATFLIGLVTILVLAFLMILEGPKMLESGLGALSPPTRRRVSAVARDAARAITGYMAGNLLISVIAGFAAFAFLWILGVPFRGVLGLWVGFADLIPLVGATLGAVAPVLVAFLHSTTAGIATIVFFVVYQQFENHVLQVTIMSRTVDLNPLLVLGSVLVGVELFGVLGALLAIPAGGVIQVVSRDLWDHRRGRPKDEPTVGEDEVPIDGAPGAARKAPAAKKAGAAKKAPAARKAGGRAR